MPPTSTTSSSRMRSLESSSSPIRWLINLPDNLRADARSAAQAYVGVGEAIKNVALNTDVLLPQHREVLRREYTDLRSQLNHSARQSTTTDAKLLEERAMAFCELVQQAVDRGHYYQRYLTLLKENGHKDESFLRRALWRGNGDPLDVPWPDGMDSVTPTRQGRRRRQCTGISASTRNVATTSMWRPRDHDTEQLKDRFQRLDQQKRARSQAEPASNARHSSSPIGYPSPWTELDRVRDSLMSLVTTLDHFISHSPIALRGACISI